jgi:MoxR-like ATPase
LRDANLAAQTQTAQERVEDTGRYLSLSWLGTALATSQERPRVLLLDEIDKSDLDLPNDLLHVLEEGQFVIPELTREADCTPVVSVSTCDVPSAERVEVSRGIVRCRTFPVIVMTSNGERDFPPAFLRRVLRLNLPHPTREHLREIVEAHLGDGNPALRDELIETFLQRLASNQLLANDQLLNALYLVSLGTRPGTRESLVELLLRGLNK